MQLQHRWNAISVCCCDYNMNGVNPLQSKVKNCKNIYDFSAFVDLILVPGSGPTLAPLFSQAFYREKKKAKDEAGRVQFEYRVFLLPAIKYELRMLSLVSTRHWVAASLYYKSKSDPATWSERLYKLGSIKKRKKYAKKTLRNWYQEISKIFRKPKEVYSFSFCQWCRLVLSSDWF